jgi:FimV-like protein
MSKEQLIHIFDNSTCLTRRQLKDYVTGAMTNEEAHAAEVHLNACPMCSDAVEGLFEQQEGRLAAIAEPDGAFLKDHFGLHNPQIHLNSITATQSHYHHHQAKRKKKSNVQPLWRTAAVAAILLLMVGSFWYYRNTQNSIANTSPTIAQEIPADKNSQIAMNEEPAPDEKAIAAVPGNQDADATDRPETTDRMAAAAQVAPTQPKPEKPGIFKKLADKVEKLAQQQSAAVVLDAMKDPEKSKYETSARNQQNDEQRAIPKGQQDADVVTKAYKVPLVDKPAADKVITAEEVEKTPTRSTANVATTSAGAYNTRSGNSYNETELKEVNAGTRKKDNAEPDALDKANKLFSQKSYGDALNVYTKEMRGSENRARRQAAAVGAAKCYTALGKTQKAKEILESIVNEGGPQKREAKRLLKEME